MAHFHTRHKAISRGKAHTVGACAYRTGTQLTCHRTGETFDYRNKRVQHVELLLPDDAPEWAQALQKLVRENRPQGVQHLSDIAEADEKRKDARVYREFEFALPCEFTDAQNIALANELIQDLCCSQGMFALQSFHFDEDPNTGQKKPHCHTLLGTRRLTETGLAPTKETAWNQKAFHQNLFAGVSAYTNFHLKKNGIDQTLDHRSYKARGIDLEPQPKRGRTVQEMSRRGYQTEKKAAFNAVKLLNQSKLLSRPETVFDIVTQKQATFVWEDVQKVLVRYFEDQAAFVKMDARLKASPALVCLQDQNTPVYTTRKMAQYEVELVRLARDLRGCLSHKLSDTVRETILEEHNQTLKQQGGPGFSDDQIHAIRHMTDPSQLSCVVGVAGAGKTTALKTVKEIYEAQGYEILGLAPTGRAARNLEDAGLQAQVLDTFLWSFDQGREQRQAKTLVVLDEAGMVDTRRLARFLSAMETRGCKVITVGDAAQLQAVQAGPAFRLLTDRVTPVRLESVVRQKQDWQRDATRLFGQQKTREALELYQKHKAFTFVAEHTPPTTTPDATVQTFLIARRMAGNLWFEMLKDCGLKSGEAFSPEAWQKIKAHPDYSLQAQWKVTREQALQAIQKNVALYSEALTGFNVDPKLLRLNAPPSYTFDETRPTNLCDLRRETKQTLVEAWLSFRQNHPTKSSLVLTYSTRDAEDLNKEIRHRLKAEGVLDKHEKRFTVIFEDRDDFDKIRQHKKDRAFAVGDRLLFLKNDRSLGVTNGTLGTVTDLAAQKIVVQLRDKNKDGTFRQVSFAPNLYPYFDHGWATTIHKAQGTTVDQTFKLASFEETRNVAYVGMTRHREDVHVFCSALEFWREEKIIDRLSRSAEKLSSLDYQTADQVLAQMREDSRILKGAHKALTTVQDWTVATAHVSKRLWQTLQSQVFHRDVPGVERPLAPSLSRESTESARAESFFAREKREIAEILTGPQEVSIDTKQEISPQKKVLSLTDQLVTHIEHLAEDLLGSPKYRTREVLKFGSQKGSLHLERQGSKRGQWFDFATGQGGGPLQLIQSTLHLDQKQAWQWAKQWVESHGLDHSLEQEPRSQRSSTMTSLSRPSEEPGARRRRNLEHSSWQQKFLPGVSIRAVSNTSRQDPEAAKKIARVQKLLQKSQPIPETLAETYLRQHRKITTTLPQDLRFLPRAYEPETKSYRPALITFGRTRQGTVTSAQLTYLDPQTANKALEITIKKRSQGLVKDAFVVLQKEKEGPLYVAEGIETALSLREAGVKGSVIATLGIFNMKNVPVQEGRPVVLCADHDGPQSSTHALLQKTKTHLEAQGAEVRVIRPDQKGHDFNDVLKTEGVAGVKKHLQEQLPYSWRMPVPPKMPARSEGLEVFSHDLSKKLEDYKTHPTQDKHKALQNDIASLKATFPPQKWDLIKGHTPELSQQLTAFEQVLQQKSQDRSR